MERCTVPGCVDEAEGHCEACSRFVCDEHGRIDYDTGGWFCGMRDDAPKLARAGRYEETTWCSA